MGGRHGGFPVFSGRESAADFTAISRRRGLSFASSISDMRRRRPLGAELLSLMRECIKGRQVCGWGERLMTDWENAG